MNELVKSIGVILLCAGTLRADDRKDLRPPLEIVPLKRNDLVSFEKEIRPILTAKCSHCHSGSVQRGRFDLGTYDALLRGGKSGPAFVPGKAHESRLALQAGRTQPPFMPPVGETELSPEELALIKLWIDQGAKGEGIAVLKREVALRPVPPRVKAIRAIAFNPATSILAVARSDTVFLIEPQSSKVIRRLGPHAAIVDALAFSPDGGLLAVGSFRELTLFDSQSGELRRRESNFADRVMAIGFSPDGKWLAVGGGAPTQSGELKLFEVKTGNLIFENPSAHADSIFGLNIHPNGTLLASAAADKFVRVFALPSGELQKSFEGHTHHALDVAWVGDGRLLASAGGDDVIKVWDYVRGEAIRTIRGHTKQISRLISIGRSAQALTASGDGTARLWNLEGGNALRVFPNRDDFLYAVAANADRSLVAAGGEDGVVRLFGPDGRLVRTLSFDR